MRVADVAVEHEERYWYPDDGAIVWVAGYAPVDPTSGRYLARDAPALAARGLVVAGVAGAAAFHDDVLQSDAVSPGAALALRRDPANEHDANAIAVSTAGGAQAGWVPREVAAGRAGAGRRRALGGGRAARAARLAARPAQRADDAAGAGRARSSCASGWAAAAARPAPGARDRR